MNHESNDFERFNKNAPVRPEALTTDSLHQTEEAPAQTRATAIATRRETRDFQLRANGTNRLLEAAMPMLGLAVRIRGLHSCDAVEPLHARLVNEVTSFQQEIEGLGYDDATVLAARYVLCAAVDEAVLSRPWGADSNWPERPLLSIFHNETWGGEKVFAILDRVLDESHRFVDLLELIYYVIALGFEGRYHVMHNGQARLDGLMNTVHQHLDKHRGSAPDQLVTPERNIYQTAQKMRRQFPIWGVLGLALLALIGMHLAFDVNLDSRIDAISAEISTTLGTGSVGTEVTE